MIRYSKKKNLALKIFPWYTAIFTRIQTYLLNRLSWMFLSRSLSCCPMFWFFSVSFSAVSLLTATSWFCLISRGPSSTRIGTPCNTEKYENKRMHVSVSKIVKITEHIRFYLRKMLETFTFNFETSKYFMTLSQTSIHLFVEYSVDLIQI